jgi:hypothetical protein
MRGVLGTLGLWWWWKRTRQTEPLPERPINESAVEELLGAVRGMLSEESDRANSLNSRAAGLTGFVGVILSIAAATGAALGKSTGTGLHHGVRVLVGWLVASALVALVVAVIAVVAKVLLPTDGVTIKTDEVKKFPRWDFIEQKPVMVQGYLMRGYIRTLERDRERHASKAKWLGRSYKIVCLGLVLVAMAGTAATIDRYVARGSDPSKQAGRRPGAHATRGLGDTFWRAGIRVDRRAGGLSKPRRGR